ILLSQEPGSDRLQVEITSSDGGVPVASNTFFADWRDDDAARTPLVEQFRIAGLEGDDTVKFVQGANPLDAITYVEGAEELDLSVLTARSDDFVAAVDGGPGSDLLSGTPGRDRLDGGRGSDVVYGWGGGDRLWGDQGRGRGSSVDHDVLYSGTGNDDLVGGQGTNELYAWSFDPSQGGQFGVFVDAAGVRFDNDGGGAYTLEDTGLNRILGSRNADDLYGGTGLDFLYGNGGDDRLYKRDGTLFEDLDAGLAGDEWKAYARSTGAVWYVSGSNANDVISVDYVTEPGLLQGHHLVTRLTENNGTFSFAAQVRLDFSATDEDGDLVWNIDDLLTDADALQEDNPFARARALGQYFSDETRLGSLLPPEGDFLAILVDALGGNDRVDVGPTVQKTVWIDAGPGDDHVEIASGKAILTDRTEGDTRNDQLDGAFALSGPAVLKAPSPAPTDGRLTADASFQLIINGVLSVPVTVRADATNGADEGTEPNATLADLIEDVNVALADAGVGGLVSATGSEGRIVLSTDLAGPGAELAILAHHSNPSVTQLGLADNDIATGADGLFQSIVYTGLTIDYPGDVDYYRFGLGDLPGGAARITTTSMSADDGMTIALLDADGTVRIAETDGTAGIDLAGLAADTDYVVRVASNLVPTIYSLHFDLGDGAEAMGVDLATPSDFPRRDVILGGEGNDVLSGGPGEDWIFGGPGNDVLTGGLDRNASDLLFGQEGDDTFQVIPDGLPLLKGTQTTYLPTFSDRFDGGEGTDRVLFLGGDLDRQGEPVDDFVAIRFNRLLQRYELASLVWDTANQAFLTETVDAPATVTVPTRMPSNGQLENDVTFRLRVNGTAEITFTVPAADTQENRDLDGLVDDVTRILGPVLNAHGIPRAVIAGHDGARLTFSTQRRGPGASLELATAGALEFDDDIVILPPDVLDGRADLTVEFWYCSQGGEAGGSVISGAREGEADGFAVILNSGTSVSVTLNGREARFDGLPDFGDDQWHHFALVREAPAGRVLLYLDGALQAPQPFGGDMFFDSGQDLGRSHSTCVALGDVDGDGDLDAFVANHLGWSNKVWLNDGSGGFVDSGQNHGSLMSHGAALGDLDGDGSLDAFVVNHYSGDQVLLNDGSGTFHDTGQT
ncbi:MAG: FG-GAP-like repeat-containing protein, partial [Planctomycetota bacterium]